jgi:hypothetical protein
MAKQRLTTYMDSDLIKTLKHHALDRNRSVASILEELVMNYFEANNITIETESKPL